jgi:hypothetical protein
MGKYRTIISMLLLVTMLGLSFSTVLAQNASHQSGQSGQANQTGQMNQTEMNQAGQTDQSNRTNQADQKVMGTAAMGTTRTTERANATSGSAAMGTSRTTPPSMPISPLTTGGASNLGVIGNATGAEGSTPQAYVKVRDQQVANQMDGGGEITIDQVMTSKPGWMMIQNSAGDIIGYTQVRTGVENNVIVRIDMAKITTMLQAMLHDDTGTIGVLDYPAADPETRGNARDVAPFFNVTYKGMEATGNAAGNASMAGSATQGTNVTSTAGTVGTTTSTGTEAVNATTAQTETSTAGTAGTTTAASTTQAGGAGKPMINVVDQAISNNQVMVAEVFSVGPGWVVIHPDLSGSPDTTRVLGYAPVNAGSSNNLAVPLQFTNRTRVTPTLWAELHKDGGRVGVFEYPGPDVEAKYANGTAVMQSFRVSGMQGTTGTKGITGITGTTGTQGTNLNASRNTSNVQGMTSTQGTTNTQGTANTQGISQASGTKTPY